MLTSDRPDWRPAIEAWDGYRIRKVVRRARGSEWRRAEALDGLTIVRGSAEVRVFPPIPIDGWPRDLARLQVSGTDLDDDVPPPAVPPGTPTVLLSPYVPMTAGKAMAQAGHAAQLGWRTLDEGRRIAWGVAGWAAEVRVPSRSQWSSALKAGHPVVHDAGFTEVAPNSQTATILF
jgi:hypothetical protein